MKTAMPTTPSADPAAATARAADVRCGAVGQSELEMVLAAWNAATDRLQKTHETLRDEVRKLSDELETKNRQLARKNRLADLGQMASHVAHEIRNGLAPVTLYLSLLRRRLGSDPGSLDVLDKMEAGFTAVEVTVNDLLNFALDREPVWGRFAVRQLITEVCESLAPQLSAQGIQVEVDAAGNAQVLADREMLRRALLNLVLNGLDAMPQGGELVVTFWQGPAGFELEVADSGPGVDRELQQRVFEPFFTTKTEGTGLGLAIVHRIAEAHGGDVQIANCPEGGAAFTLRIPRHAMEAAA